MAGTKLELRSRGVGYAYRGSRYSFGYPACPNLEDQTKLFALLHAEESIGVRVTTGFLLDLERRTSAIIVHHPAAKYFGA
jgi:5-methyltetrahydrofolate--homocysteine methyltransferase